MTDELLGLFQSLDDTPTVKENVVRAPFGYPGAKSRSLEQILPLIPYDKKYVEVFGGSGAVLLARKKSKFEVFNDRFAGVVCFYRCVRDHKKLKQLCDRLEVVLHAREEFIWCRDTWEDCDDEVERASRWFYMVQASFTSQGRNFGRSLNGNNTIARKIQNSLKEFHFVHERLKDVLIENQDWRDILKDFDGVDTVFYLDPPYLDTSSVVYKHTFSRADHVELLDRIFKTQGFIALSGYDNPLYNSYSWDKKYSWDVRVTVTANAFTETNNQKEGADRKNIATECLWIKEAYGN